MLLLQRFWMTGEGKKIKINQLGLFPYGFTLDLDIIDFIHSLLISHFSKHPSPCKASRSSNFTTKITHRNLFSFSSFRDV